MKKITSFLLMMVMCCISAFAQYEDALKAITDLSELKDDAVYTIHSERTFLMYNSAFPDRLSTGNGTKVVDSSWNPFDVDQQFKIVTIEDKYYLYNMGINLYVNQDGTWGEEPLHELKITPATSAEYPWILAIGPNFFNSQGTGQTENGIQMNTYSTEDPGNHYNIFEIDMSAYDPYAMAVNNLSVEYAKIDAEFVEKLKNNENVGNNPGNYQPEYVQAFLKLFGDVDEFMYAYEMYESDPTVTDPKEICPTPEDVDKLAKDLTAAYNAVLNNIVSRAMAGIAPGYYTFNCVYQFYTTKNDTVFYTQDEADAANLETGVLEGDEGYIAAGDVKEVKSLKTRVVKSLRTVQGTSNGVENSYMYWQTPEERAEFLWKIEAVDGKPTEYRMTNVHNGKTMVGGLSANGYVILHENDTATVCFDWRNDNEPFVEFNANGDTIHTGFMKSFNIRSSKDPESNYSYLHCGGHNNGTGNRDFIIGWADGGVTRWYMTPIDEATVEEWINGPAAQLRQMVANADSIANAFPAQLKVAKDLVADLDTTTKVANVDNFFSPFSCTAEGAVEQLFDGIGGQLTNFWHSEWQSGTTSAFSKTNGTNYFVINDTEGLINGGLAVMLKRRDAANDHVLQFTVYGTNDDYDVAVATEALKADSETKNDTYNWTELGVLETPRANNQETVISNAIEFEGKYSFYKFVATSTVNSRGYFHMGEFQLYPATISKRYETTQYDVRKAEADALAAAIAAWEEKEYSKDSLHLLNDEEFNSIYSTLITAAEAWGKVYVDPTALREAIDAAPAENLFVIGNNPGQWKEGVVTPAKVVADATAYNVAGAYTPAESEEYLNAIAKAVKDVWAAANKIQTGKWYRFSFPTEEMFETYGWEKANIDATINDYNIETSPSLLGKIVAVGKSVKTYPTFETEEGLDTATVYSFEATDEWFDGDNLGFFEEEFSDGEDLFQFIQATDSSYIIQNKATGLFVRGGRPMTLSAIPSYFSANEAVGAGGNVIAYTNIFGETESAHVYMHAEQQTQLLTAWQDKSALKSMMMIEEVEAVNDVPTTEYTTKLWPGKVYTYTMPVDVKVVEGATAYGAELSMEENDTCVVLKAIEAETISAGTPFIMIADLEADYISTSDRLKQIKEEIAAETGNLTVIEEYQASVRLNNEYFTVVMDHGMEVDTVVTELLGMKGTMKPITVTAGKGVVANENGFAHIRTVANIAAYSAYITSDFDPKSADVLSTLEIKIEGSIDTGISEVLDKVAKSGNIYNAAGQLVGKGNINTVNNLPAGIYIVNGVKVTKK